MSKINFAECIHIDKPEYGEIFGNVHKIGATGRRICRNEYNRLKRYSGKLICKPDGQWNVTECIHGIVFTIGFYSSYTIIYLLLL